MGKEIHLKMAIEVHEFIIQYDSNHTGSNCILEIRGGLVHQNSHSFSTVG